MDLLFQETNAALILRSTLSRDYILEFLCFDTPNRIRAVDNAHRAILKQSALSVC